MDKKRKDRHQRIHGKPANYEAATRRISGAYVLDGPSTSRVVHT
jgi:hypothetical protein